MINEERSYTEYNVEVPTTDFPIGFNILDDGLDVVAVTLNDVDPTTLGYTVIQVNNTTYRFAPAVPSGVVRLTRITDIDQMAHVFTEGAIFISENMDGNFKQIRHAQQEVRDGFNKLATDTNAIIDTLQVVGEAARDAAAAAEAAAQTANDAAAQVNDKASYQDLDNAVEVAVKNNTAYFYSTVAQMIAATNLTDGAVVATKGYHNISDAGGAVYLISAVGTDYSIPLANDLHAVFRDTFDIRKFGIISSTTLDQTTNLLRMRNYADTRVYEIDFLDFDLMSPKCINFTTTRGTVMRGLYFQHIHRLKNLRIHHDKTETLVQGSTPLQFTPKIKGNGTETFELQNIHFDLYNPNYYIFSGEGDGRLHGFQVGWHIDYPVPWPEKSQTPSGYNLKVDGVYADTAALTSTIACSFWLNRYELSNAFGDYIGYYSTFAALNFVAKNVKGVYRDDLHDSARWLVTTLLHSEPEVGGAAYHVNKHNFEDIEVYKKTTGLYHVAIKYQQMGTPTLDHLVAKDVIGSIQWGKTASDPITQTINFAEFDNTPELDALAFKSEGSIKIKNSKLNRFLFKEDTYKQNCEIKFNNCEIPRLLAIGGSADDAYSTLPNLYFKECTVTGNIIRDSKVELKGAFFNHCKFKKDILIDCDWEVIEVTDCEFDKVDPAETISFFVQRGHGKYLQSTASISKSKFKSSARLLVAVTAERVTTNSIACNVFYNEFAEIPTFRLGGAGVLRANFNSKQLTGIGSKSYNPVSIEAGLSKSTTVTVLDCPLGTPVVAAFSAYNVDLDIRAVVSSANTVLVTFKNTGATSISIPTGILTVKVI